MLPAPHGSEGTFILLFVTASAVAIAAGRARMPYTVALVLTGLVLGALHLFEPPTLTKELLFTLFLPGLLFEAAFHLEFAEFRRNALAMAALAVPGVVVAMVATAAILTPIAQQLGFEQGFGWPHALVFGAVIAATDPVAVVALFRSLRAPARLSVLVEGESLLNDGTAIVLFTLILGYATGSTVSVGGLVLQFLRVVGEGAVVGAVVGLVVSEVVRRVDDPMIEITLTTIAAYGAFGAAEHLNASGVIATVVAGMLCGNYAARTGMSPTTRVAAQTFWDYVAFALNSVIFLLIGFRVEVTGLLSSWVPIVVAYLAVMVARGLVITGVGAALRPTRERIPARWIPALTWAGLRGGLSMVLALTLPPTFPHHDLIVTMTYGVVILSILLNGLTIGPLFRWLGIAGAAGDHAEYELARGLQRATRAALSELDRMVAQHDVSLGDVAPLRAEYQGRLEEGDDRLYALHLERREIRDEEVERLRRHLVQVEKARIIEDHHTGLLGYQAYHQLLQAMDARLLRAKP
jgi:Na+:H+ antiporter